MVTKNTVKKNETRKEKREKAYKFFLDRGYAPHMAAGLVGNLEQESGLQTDVLGFDGTGSYGIAQWLGDRKDKLKEIQPYNWNTFEGQLEFIDWELKNTETKAYKKLLESRDALEAALNISKFYERPHKDYAHNEKRMKYAYNNLLEFAPDEIAKIDPNLYSLDQNGNYIVISTETATPEQIQESELYKRMFYQENSKRLLLPIEQEVVEEETKVPDWQKELNAKQQERDNIIDFITKGNLHLQNVDYQRQALPEQQQTFFQDGGKKDPPTEDEGAVYYGTPEYEQAYREGRLQGQELDEVVVTADKRTGKNILEDYPFYNQLTPQEKEFFNDNSPIGTQIRAKAQDGKGVNAEKAAQIPGLLLQGAEAALQTPQSFLVEGVEALRGNDYDFTSTLPGQNQRVPSDVWGYENPEGFFQNAANIGMDIALDPLNVVPTGAASKGIKAGSRKGLTSSAKQKSIEALKKQKKVDGKLNNKEINESFLAPQDKEAIKEAQKIFRDQKEKIFDFFRKEPNYKKTVEKANQWSKDWYNHPKRQELLNNAEEAFSEALKDGRVSGKNPFSLMKQRIKDEEFVSQLVNSEGRFKDTTLGISGYGLEKGKEGRQNLVFIDRIKNHIEANYKDLNKSQKAQKVQELVDLVSVHEGNHGFSDGISLLPKYYQDDMVKIFGESAKVPKRNASTGSFDSYDDYIKNPPEIYARIMEARKHFKLRPDEEVSVKKAKQIKEAISKGETPINWVFGKLIKDVEKFAEVMNYLPAALPVAGAASLYNSEEEQTSSFKDGGKYTTNELRFLADYLNQQN